MKKLGIIATSLATVFNFYSLGCGDVTSPKILQILPQTLSVGAPPTTMQVKGVNFGAQSVVLWNGMKLSTSLVDPNTVSTIVPSNTLAVPAVGQVQVLDLASNVASLPQTVVVAATSLAVKTTTLPTAVLGRSYRMTLAASAGTAPYTWSVPSHSLPAGLVLNSTTGIISGTPTAIGSFSIPLTVKDSSSPALTAASTLSMAVVAAPQSSATTGLSIPTTTLASVAVNQPYDSLVTATGGTLPYTWSLNSGTLPAGLSFSTVWGLIYGTPTVSGVYSFTATVTDSSSPALTATATFSLSVTSASSLSITSSNLTAGIDGQAYKFTVLATGGTPAYTWSIGSGSLPAGLTLGATTGIISGTPTVSGTFPFTLSVADAGTPVQKKSLSTSLTVASQTLTITTTGLPVGTSGSGYRKVVQASGGTSPYTWALTSGNLPAGITFGSSNGELFGTPTVAGTFTVGITVTDAANKKLAKTFSLIVDAAPSALTIGAITLPAATSGKSYTGSLKASGGTPAYTWSVTNGSLPAGLTLSSSGSVSGTPTTTGKSSFTATVTDSAKPTVSVSTTASITVASPALSITTPTLSSGTEGTAYSAALAATGGTPAYTWSITGTLPTGLTLAATTGTISGTPTTSGTFNLTANVHDSGNPEKTASTPVSITVAAGSTPTGPGVTWYIRADGGTRYSPRVTQGQCDGQADAPYSGSGTNQHCAFNDFRYLYDDQSYGNSAWVIAGGDTVIVRGGPWRIGFNQGTSPNDVWCYGGNGNQACSEPTIPAGTPTQPTRILGENYASCGSATTTDRTKLTQIFGGFGLGTAFNLTGAKNVDVQCLEITRHSDCITHGTPALPSQCSSAIPIDDFDSDGIATDINTANVTLTDMWIHGHTDRGIIGPIGGVVTCLRCDISYNGMAGWDFDPGDSTPSPNGTWNLLYSTISWNGCNQEYPAVDTFPATSCYSQSTGGYGDGVGTPPGFCMNVVVDHSNFSYNTQDGLDLGHLNTVGASGVCTLSITNSTAYANNGATFKWGPGPTAAVFLNNLAEANCLRMSAPLIGAPSSYNANLADFCRSQDNISFNFYNKSTVTMANNTVIGYSPTTFDIACSDATSCALSVFTFKNNLVIGYDNPTTYDMGGQGGGPGGFCLPGCNASTLPIGIRQQSNNVYYGIRNYPCPTAFPSEFCEDPLLVNEPTGRAANFVESELDNFNFHPTSTSPVLGAGVFLGLTDLKLDYFGTTRPNPPSIGGVE